MKLLMLITIGSILSITFGSALAFYFVGFDYGMRFFVASFIVFIVCSIINDYMKPKNNDDDDQLEDETE